MNHITRRRFAPWIAAGFCAFLSLIAVSLNIILTFVTHSAVNDTLVFVCFMPMCFVFAGIVMRQMQCEITELKQQVADLRGKSEASQST